MKKGCNSNHYTWYTQIYLFARKIDNNTRETHLPDFRLRRSESTPMTHAALVVLPSHVHSHVTYVESIWGG